MWLENLKELRKSQGNPSSEWIAERAKIPLRTVNRIFAGETDCPKADNLYKIVKALNGSLDDILKETDVVVGNEDKITLQENVDVVTVENDILVGTITRLEGEIARLQDIISHKNEVIALKDEIIETHKYYRKLPSEVVST